MKRRMKLLEKTDEEILEIANPIWDNLVQCSNNKNYSGLKRPWISKLVGL